MPPGGRAEGLLRLALLVAGIALILWTLPRIEIVRGHHEELRWLRDHTTTQTYVVTELGIARPDGTAISVLVADPGYPDAFIDLSHSAQRVRTEGQRVQARVDHRIPNSVGTGVADDAIDHRFVHEYVQAGWPSLLAMALLALMVALPRGRRAAWRH